MGDNIDLHPYPPGWECRFDRRTGRHYYINYLTKMTTWEDPRIRFKVQQNQSTPQHHPIDYVPQQQTGHGSPYHVYPYPSPVPLQHAFQPPPYPSTYSPKTLTKQIVGSPLSGGSPILGRGLSLTPKGSPVPSRVYSLTSKLQETSISLAADTEASVAKISSMFPTVSETHIKILLKKYYNREAVVISALQVEKHPISTPGPFSTPPAGASRLQQAAAAACAAARQANARQASASPRASPPTRPNSGASGTWAGSPRTRQSSPKMKLRYLKSVFPKAEETLILDMLASEENNVQRASEKLMSLGYFKRETVPPRLSLTHKEAEAAKAAIAPHPPVTPPRLKSIEEKQSLKKQLQKKYSSIADKVVSIALESVDWSEERAEQILSVVLQEDVGNKKAKDTSKESLSKAEAQKDSTSPETLAALSSQAPTQATPQLKELPSNGKTVQADKTNRRHKTKSESAKPATKLPSEPSQGHRSPYLAKTSGPNPLLIKGAQDQLLLVDYITWNGANPELKTGSSVIIKGSLKYNKDEKISSLKTPARGANKDLCKGPTVLPKGSIYQHINQPNNLTQMKV